MSKNTPDKEEFHVYLPFPQYNDEALMDRLHRVDVPNALGRWHRKGLGLDAVGIIVGVVGIAVGPEWTHVYNERIRPKILRLFGHLEKEEGVAYDYYQEVNRLDGGTLRLILVADHRDWKASLDPRRVDGGIRVAMDFLLHSELATLKTVSQVRLKYQPETESYRVMFVQYDDGEHITLG